ncbi:MAG: quinone-dependent dihydroorotate dehydrogenase [Methylococcales bacterium]|nr:quinone-dependent dihydroorotate dehydrogenase [Methylococcales bacterium]
MDVYSALQPLLFQLPPETAHNLSLNGLKCLHGLGATSWLAQTPPPKPVSLMGLTFANPVGLAAGLDKNGDYIDALGALGFGFVEIGTVTPRPQPGNPRPRLFRLPEQRALLNRMGFNNKGVAHLAEKARQRRYTGVLGINLGKNFDTPLEHAAKDYCSAMAVSYPAADYLTINISSPNTRNLRDLQRPGAIEPLLRTLKTEQTRLAEHHQVYRPLLVKIAPDLEQDALRDLAKTFVATGMDGVIATNTTITRPGLANHALAEQAGGLSGAPLLTLSTEKVAELADMLAGRLPIIAAGGIFSAEDALAKHAAGAALVQIYSGFVYRGPALIHEIVHSWPLNTAMS